MKHRSIVPTVFLLLSLLSLFFSGMRIPFVINEVIVRFIRDGIMVLALIIPVTAGMGLNFAVIIGAMCAQTGVILALDHGLSGIPGLLFITATGLLLSLATGALIGVCLNRVRGREMITTIIIGFVGTALYQLVFMAGYGTLITPSNREMVLSRGIGIRNMVDLAPFRDLTDSLWTARAGSIEIPLFMILVVLCVAAGIHYLMGTGLGRQFKAVGEDSTRAALLGIDVAGVRIRAMVISTVLACMGQIVYTQNIGMLNVYTAHLNSDIFSCAALLAGGATINRANIFHAFSGILLFHTLFIVSPQAGQNIFSNPALGEYFRSFAAYGTIAFALMMNAGQNRPAT